MKSKKLQKQVLQELSRGHNLKSKELVIEIRPTDLSVILDKEDIEYLSSVYKEITKYGEIRRIGRPKPLMEISVLKDIKFPTPDSKFWQCILERDVQYENLIFALLDYEEKLGQVISLTARINKLEKEYEKSRDEEIYGKIMSLNAKRKRLLYQTYLIKKTAKERVREIRDWTELIEKIKKEGLKYGDKDPDAHWVETILIRGAAQKQIIDEIGASDMNGAINIIGLGRTASRIYKEKKKES